MLARLPRFLDERELAGRHARVDQTAPRLYVTQELEVGMLLVSRPPGLFSRRGT